MVFFGFVGKWLKKFSVGILIEVRGEVGSGKSAPASCRQKGMKLQFRVVLVRWKLVTKFSSAFSSREVGIRKSASTMCRQKGMGFRVGLVRLRWGVVDFVFGHHFDRGSRGSWVREVRPDELSSKKEWSFELRVGRWLKVVEDVFGQHFDRGSRGLIKEVRCQKGMFIPCGFKNLSVQLIASSVFFF